MPVLDGRGRERGERRRDAEDVLRGGDAGIAVTARAARRTREARRCEKRCGEGEEEREATQPHGSFID
jgi:hypothetical protein